MKSLMFDIRHLGHDFQDENGKKNPALSDITAQIYKGEFIAVIGTNGSGKSTLARHMNALLLPSEGDLIVDGMSVMDEKNLWDIRQHVGMVFQNPDNQIVAALVEEDVAFGPENIGVPPKEIAERVDFALKRVGMEDYRQHSPAMLSGGQKQRVAIAGIMAMKPECIVLDEPTAMLDPVGRKEVMDTIHDLNENEGITVVLITHFMEEAVTADRVIVIDQGKLRMIGTPREVFEHVEELIQIGLDVPVPVDLANRLAEKGLPIKKNCITDSELGDALCPFVPKI